MTVVATLRRALLLLAPVAAVILMMLTWDLFLALAMIDEPLPFQIRVLIMALLLSSAGSVTAYVTLLLSRGMKSELHSSS
jgi:hypothetical protein